MPLLMISGRTAVTVYSLNEHTKYYSRTTVSVGLVSMISIIHGLKMKSEKLFSHVLSELASRVVEVL